MSDTIQGEGTPSLFPRLSVNGIPVVCVPDMLCIPGNLTDIGAMAAWQCIFGNHCPTLEDFTINVGDIEEVTGFLVRLAARGLVKVIHGENGEPDRYRLLIWEKPEG